MSSNFKFASDAAAIANEPVGGDGGLREIDLLREDGCLRLNDLPLEDRGRREIDRPREEGDLRDKDLSSLPVAILSAFLNRALFAAKFPAICAKEKSAAL